MTTVAYSFSGVVNWPTPAPDADDFTRAMNDALYDASRDWNQRLYAIEQTFGSTPKLINTAPTLGTPLSGVLTNCTGLPISTGVSGLGSGVATFLATPSSANLAAALSDEVGTGNAAFQSVGTWTPAIAVTTAGDLAITYATQLGFYERTGNAITASFSVTTSAFTWTTASGGFTITGLPVASISTTGYRAVGCLSFGGFTKVGNILVPVLPANSTAINFQTCGSGVARATAVIADFPTGGTVELFGTVSYRV